MKRKRLFLIDGAGYYYRAYYGIRQHLVAPDGTPTNAIYGFARMFMRIVKEEKPDLLAIALDSPGKTFRHRMYSEYKANRQKMPEELSAQIPLIEELISAFNLPVLKKEGYEADDLIGSAAVHAEKEGYAITIVSGDKDLMQLVGGHINIFDPLKEKWYGPDEVKEKLGVAPEQVTDMLALMGDSSDNIPGVPGVGEKTATSLIVEYSSVENLLEHVSGIKKPKLKDSLIANADLALLSKKLAQVDTRVPLEMDPHSWELRSPLMPELLAFYARLGFKSLLDELGEVPKKPVRREYISITRIEELHELVARLKETEGFAVDTETTSTEPMRAGLVGISISLKEGEAYYIPLGHDYEGAPTQIPKEDALKLIKPVLEGEKVEKFGQNIKYDLIVLKNEGIEVNPVSFDTMVASYVLAPDERRHNLSHLASKYLGVTMQEYSDVAGKGAKEVPFNKVEVKAATDYSAEDAEVTFELTGLLKAEIRERELEKLYYGIELPLIPVLAEMEENGILLDVKRLEAYSSKLEKQLSKLEEEIYGMAGEPFNLASPKQLSAVLFDRLGLQKVRKTKTGTSTDQEVLETLALEHPLPGLVLRHRVLSKLRSTYIEPLPRMVNPRTGRIHTSFNQTSTATGRLSSSDPNLQNIPIRTDEGREIRRAFHAPSGHLLVSADYSQVELRVLAHMSGDPVLVESFRKGEDIHNRTAREIFGAIGEPSEQHRRVAKAVNFGIIYGQTAFGLSRELGISRKEAQQYIDNYFIRYRGVREFIDSTLEQARKTLSVTTLFGRNRRLPEIGSVNRTAREMAERMAVNSVVQGTAADIMKMAMLQIHRRIRGTRMKLLLQVHDELILECPEKEKKHTMGIMRDVMESAANLAVPLKVSVAAAGNWGEL